MTDIVAAGQLRAFVERIIRMKEEQDTIAADIRDIYAEAKGSGFDKTTMGQVVSHVRKVGKLGVAAVEESQTMFDLYLDAYQRGNGTNVATHTHEKPNSPSHAAVVTDEYLREPVAAERGQIIREGDAPRETDCQAGEASQGGKDASSPDTQFEPPAFLVKAAKPLRPLCLNPSECAGYGTHTCHQCLKVAGQTEVAA